MNKKNDYQGFNAADVTPSDSTDLPVLGCKLFIGTGGDIKVKMSGNAAVVTFKNLSDGTFLPIYVDRVYDADTDALNIVALW